MGDGDITSVLNNSNVFFFLIFCLVLNIRLYPEASNSKDKEFAFYMLLYEDVDSFLRTIYKKKYLIIITPY